MAKRESVAILTPTLSFIWEKKAFGGSIVKCTMDMWLWLKELLIVLTLLNTFKHSLLFPFIFTELLWSERYCATFCRGKRNNKAWLCLQVANVVTICRTCCYLQFQVLKLWFYPNFCLKRNTFTHQRSALCLCLPRRSCIISTSFTIKIFIYRLKVLYLMSELHSSLIQATDSN